MDGADESESVCCISAGISFSGGLYRDFSRSRNAYPI